MLIARLIAETDGLETRLEAAAKAMAKAKIAKGSQIGSRVLEDGRTIMQITVEGGDKAALRAVVETHLQPDAALLTERSFEPLKLFVSDMDSTMIAQECIDELADFAGLKADVAAITERAMQGELDFEASLRERVALLKGLDKSAIEECLAKRIVAMDGARTLVQTLKSRGCRTVLVTGGFHQFADAIGEQLGFDRVVGNTLDVVDGKLTGKVIGPIADASTKLKVLQEERALLETGAVLATGDGANDVPMLGGADYGFAYKAKPAAKQAASGWIDGGDLTAILHLLDVPKESWAD